MPSNGHTATEPAGEARTTRSDTLRVSMLIIVAVAQLAAGGWGGSGASGESVGTVANAYPNPLLPAGAAFSIWSLIYIAFIALAIFQALPDQRPRPLHRRTGWWLFAAGLLNCVWVLLFSNRQILAAQLVIIALLGCLATAVVRAGAASGHSRTDRLLLHTPIALYTGWVSMATVVGALTVVSWARIEVGETATVAVLAASALLIGLALTQWRAIAGYLAAVVWALAWIAAAATGPVRYASIAVGLVLLVLALIRILRSNDRAATAFG